VLALPLLLAACGSPDRTIAQNSLSHLILRGKDVGRPFTPFYVGRQASLDNQGTPRTDPARYGREGGWIARFRRGGAPATRGPLIVESRADLFRDADGAKKDLADYGKLLGASTGAEPRALSLPKIGDAALGATFVQPGVNPLRFFRIAWRYRNATASVLVEGFDGKVRQADAVALAQKQQSLLERA
jgi:hypothetical protein